jgi:protein involved in polysaccharide export with SLBB domain
MTDAHVKPGRHEIARIRETHYLTDANRKEYALGLWDTLKRATALRNLVAGTSLLTILALAGGCETRGYFDQTELGRFEKRPLTVRILKNLDTGYEEPDAKFVNAGGVRPADLVSLPSDYVIGRNDLLQVSIADLVAPNVESQKISRVSETGSISLPWIGQIKAAGLTEAQLEQAIIQAYRDANFIPNAQVSVVTVEARSRTFSIYGAVNQTGQFAIIDSNFRLLDALVLARDFSQPVGIDYVYVIRKQEHDLTEVPEGATVPATQPTDVLTPRSEAPMPKPKMMMQDPPTTQPGTDSRIIVVDDQPMQIEGGVVTPGQRPAVDPAAPGEPTPFEGFNDLEEPSGLRVIRIPVDALRRGELRYNVVIRPQDFIWVPQPNIGEYYMGGHVQRTGVYSLTARNISLMQAVIAAGGLDQLAWPERTMVVRRLSTDQQVFARVDLAKIFQGEQPDIMLKPDDQIYVGTNALAPFLAAFRNGFRLTYGFGFIYDRNYWDDPNQ